MSTARDELRATGSDAHEWLRVLLERFGPALAEEPRARLERTTEALRRVLVETGGVRPSLNRPPAGDLQPPALTRKQSKLLDYVTSYREEQGVAPTLRECATHMGVNSLATIHEHLVALEGRGLLHREFNQTRGMTPRTALRRAG